MSNFRHAHPLGFRIDAELSAPQTPGPLGLWDSADPNVRTLPGCTPGPLGWQDLADPNFCGGLRLRLDEGIPQLQRGAPPVRQAPPLQAAVQAHQLKRLFTRAKDEMLAGVLQDVATRPVAFGLDTALRLAHFFAHVREEVGPSMVDTRERLNYHPEVLIKKFSYYKRHPDEAREHGYDGPPGGKQSTRRANATAIADRAYANRLGNGPVSSGDGSRFLGRGFIQITGRSEYANITRWYQRIYQDSKVDFLLNPELAEQFPWSLRTAVCYWLSRGLPEKADRGPTDSAVDSITAVINKFTDSYEQRKEHFRTIWAAIQS